MPRPKKSTENASPAVQAPPPIENDIFADDVKWLKENNGKEKSSSVKKGGAVTQSQPSPKPTYETPNFASQANLGYIEDPLMPDAIQSVHASVIDNSNTSTGSGNQYYQQTTTTSPNTLPKVPTTIPDYQPNVPTTIPDGIPSLPTLPAIPSYPTIPTAPTIPSIPNYENVNYNLMNNQNPAQQVYVNETSLWSIEWTIPTIRTIDVNGVEIASYKDVVCSVRSYANDAYNVKQVSEASRWVFAMIHTTMDAIRKHAHQINMDSTKDVDYLAIMDPGMLNILTSFRKHMLDKRLGYPRITVKCRYGFKMPESNVDVKVEAYEHTDPLEFYAGTMISLEPMRRIENMHRKLEEQIIDQRKQLFGNGQQGLPVVEPQNASPAQNYTSNPAPGYSAQSAQPAQNVPNAGVGTSTLLDCRTDDDAQNAEFNTLIAYHADRVYRKDGKFNFYMPTASSDQRARPKGIYAYEQGKGASTVIEQALRDGRLPPLQNGESTNYDVTIIALKLPTQSGAAKYEVKDIIRIATPQ